MTLTSESPLSNDDRHSIWRDRYYRATGVLPNVKTSCYMCDKTMFVSIDDLIESPRPTCGTKCKDGIKDIDKNYYRWN